MADYSLVGKRTSLKDAPEKVTGRAIFAVDIKLPGMLYARLLRSPYAHARVLRVDTSRAEKMPGVKAVLTKNNAPRTLVPVTSDVPSDKVAFGDEVRFAGEEVAAVAAISEEIAEEALKLITVDYEELPAVFDVEKSILPGAPRIHEKKENNIVSSVEMREGDIDTGFKGADFIVEETFRTPSQRHCCLETHTAIASFDAAGRLTVWTSSQTPFQFQQLLGDYLKMPMSKIRVVKPYVGGGFGGKLELIYEPICALLSRMTGCPVRISMDREEEFTATVSRHAFVLRIKVGVKKNGDLTALEATELCDEGAYLLKTGVLILASKTLFGCYRCPNVRVKGQRIYTNTMSAGAMRGYGNPQATFALEAIMDMVAEKLGMDPAEFRLKNYRQKGDLGLNGLTIATPGLTECVKKGRDLIEWGRRSRKGEGVGARRRGLGMACASHLTGTGRQPDFCAASIRLNEDGTAHLFIGVSDLGTGIDTTLAQIAAEELGLKLEEVEIVSGDTNTASFDKAAQASKTLYNAGNAVKAVVADVKQKLLAQAAAKLKANPADIEFSNGCFNLKEKPGTGLTYRELVKQACKTPGDNRTFIGEASFANTAFPVSYGAQFAEVEVDLETGQVEVTKLVSVQDNGQSINPTVIEGQVQGALQQSIGYTITENPVLDKRTGKMLNPRFASYHLLTAVDMPKIVVHSVEIPDETGPFGAKGLGEIPIISTAPAIANAIYDAIGIRFKEIPITQEKVFMALRAIQAKDQ
jgi:CO/xanthine dehydrogenase Mo-binding subunit